ncbi:hypothetical protein pb186bvf_010733 [Paramecium bursaria]
MINQGDDPIPDNDVSPVKSNYSGKNYRNHKNLDYLNNDVNEVVQNHQQYYYPVQQNYQPYGQPPQQQNFQQQQYNQDLPPPLYQQPYQQNYAISPTQPIPQEHLDEKKRRELEAKREEDRRRKQQNQEKQHSGHQPYYNNGIYLYYYDPDPVMPQQVVVVENNHDCRGNQQQNFNAGQANAQNIALSAQPSTYCCCGVCKRNDPCSLWCFHSCWDLLSCPFRFIQFVLKTIYECTFKGICHICCQECTKHIDSCVQDFSNDVDKKASDVQNFCSTECIGSCTCLNFNLFNCLQKNCKINCSCQTCDSPKKCWDSNTKDCCAATGTCGQIYNCCCGGNIFMSIFQFILDCFGEIFKFLGQLCENLLSVIQYIATCQCLEGLGDCICSAFDCSCSACDDCGNCDCGGCDCGGCDCDLGGCDLGGCL